MLGAIIGDIIGSLYEFESDKTKDFELFTASNCPTDDSLMTIAVGLACAQSDISDERAFKQALKNNMRRIGRAYPDAGYGAMFYNWLMDDHAYPYGSIGNGSAMRVSPCGWVMDTLEDTERLAMWSAEVTHDSPEGIRGAKAVAAAIFMARNGSSKDEIREYIEEKYYDLDFTVDGIRDSYSFDVTCDGSVPQAIVCFLDGEDYEDTLRNAVSLGGDGDTIAAIAGSIAEAYFGIPEDIQETGLSYLDGYLTYNYFEYADELYR